MIKISAILLTIAAGGASVGIYFVSRWGVDRIKMALKTVDWLKPSEVENIVLALDLILMFAPLGFAGIFSKFQKAKNFLRMVQGFILLIRKSGDLRNLMTRTWG